MTLLRAAVVIDYQNVHLVGAGLFHQGSPSHEHLVHPLKFALNLVAVRNSLQREGMPMAVLTKVLVYRGLPSAVIDPKPYARNLAQQMEWERDERLSVTQRPLKYSYKKTSTGRKSADIAGRPIVLGKQEKGVDVLCALAVMRETRRVDTSLVILASQDTDLEPALDEAFVLGLAKIETASWFDVHNPRKGREIRPTAGRIWNTRLGREAFTASQDMTEYN